MQDQLSNGMPLALRVWWIGLIVVSIVNIGVWAFAARALANRRATTPRRLFVLQGRQLMFSAVYVAVCAFRAVLPRADVQRIVLVDSWWSSVLVGRTAATIAELCFMAQWALLIGELGRVSQRRGVVVLAWMVVPFIAIAECFSWYATLTTNFLGNAVEQSIWTLTAAALTCAALLMLRHFRGKPKLALGGAALFGAGFVVFMCTVDVPMYVTRYLADEAAGRAYLTLADGLNDLNTRWVKTFSWLEWRDELAWMALYFSLAVWSSIALTFTPQLDDVGDTRR